MSTLTYNHLISFSNALDTHILDTDCFFDDKFLALVDKHLGYRCCSFVVYDANRTYKTSHGHNVTMGKSYEEGFLPQDPLARYITQHFDELLSREIKVIRASEIFSDYYSSKYYQVLKLFSDLSYAAVIPFDTLRLTVYKTEEEGDFSDSEVLLLNSLIDIITSKYTLFSKVIRPTSNHTLTELKNKYFDTLSTGVIILDINFRLLDCNNIGHQYMKTLSPSHSISDYFSNLLPLLNLSFSAAEGSQTDRVIKLEDFILTIHLYTNEHSETPSQRAVYFVIIKHGDSGAEDVEISEERDDSADRMPAFAEKYHLSQREMDVVKALSSGQKYQDIADTLFISVNTVRTHVKNIYRKLEIDNQRTLLYLYNQFLQGMEV